MKIIRKKFVGYFSRTNLQRCTYTRDRDREKEMFLFVFTEISTDGGRYRESIFRRTIFFPTCDQFEKYFADSLFICFVFVRQIFDQYEFLLKSQLNIDLSMEIYTCQISTKISDLRAFLSVEYGFSLKNKSSFSCEKKRIRCRFFPPTLVFILPSGFSWHNLMINRFSQYEDE